MSDVNNSHSTLSAEKESSSVIEKVTSSAAEEETSSASVEKVSSSAYEETSFHEFSSEDNSVSGVKETAASSAYSSSADKETYVSSVSVTSSAVGSVPEEKEIVSFTYPGIYVFETSAFDEHASAAVDAWQYSIANRLDIIAYTMLICAGLLFFLVVRTINITKK